MRFNKIAIIALTGTALALTAVLGAQAWHYRGLAIRAEVARDDYIREASVLRERLANETRQNRQIRENFVRISAGAQSPSDVETSREIRDYVYRTNVVGSSKGHADGFDIFSNLGRPDHEQLCGGMSVAHAWALRAAGIPARTVQLAAQTYLDGTERGDTHVTVETFIEGAWRISDPTFNIELQCSDDAAWLDTEGARQCVARGEKLVAFMGETQIDGRTLADYYAPFEAFLAAYDVESYEDGSFSAPQLLYPSPTWRGEALKLYLTD
jgi:hypothetical protein